MNLTFYENSKEDLYNFYSSKNDKSVFPSIFSKFETEKNFSRDSLCIKLSKNKIFLPKYKNIKQEMAKIKKQFRNLFNIKNTIFKKMMTKKNSTTYRNFIKGFGKYFFGPFGLVTQKNKFLREYYFMNSALNVKIYAGRLEYYDYINKYNRYKQRQNNSHKHMLSISNNYAVLDDKNDIYSIKAKTSNRLFKRRKDFVSLNIQKYRNSITEIKEILPINDKKKGQLINKSFNDKNSRYYIQNKIKSKLKIKKPLYLKTINNFYTNKNNNILNYHKRIVTNIKNKYSKIYNSSEAEKARIYSNNNIKTYKVAKKSDNFFLTQGNFNSKKFLKNKISFNGIIKLKNYKPSLNRFNK